MERRAGLANITWTPEQGKPATASSIARVGTNSEPAFYQAHAAKEPGKVKQSRDGPAPCADVYRRIAGIHSARFDVVGNARLCSDSRARADRQVAGGPNLTAKLRAGADLRASGQTDLRGEERALADLAAVTDLYEVVDLRRAANPRDADRRTIDRGVGADFDAVFEHDASRLRDCVHTALLVWQIAEAVGADHRACLELHVVADLRAL